MKNIKKYAVLSLATIMLVSPVLAKADSTDKLIMPINTNVEVTNILMEESKKDYIEYTGVITEVNKYDGRMSILVKDQIEDPYNGYLFHINEENIIVNGKAQEIVTEDKLEEGMTVTAYYPTDTMMALSIPAQLSPSVIVIRDLEDITTIEVSKFDEEMLSADKMLKLNISQDTKIVDRNGKETTEIVDKDLLVMYKFTTKSIPAQTTPETIIVLNKEEKITNLNKVIINHKEVILKAPIYTNENNIVMIPLREISEELGYKVQWNNDTQSVELIKGPHWFNITIGEDNYNFAKMIVKLGASPELNNSSTYVPINFINEVLQYNIKIVEAVLNITE